jgi:hypothetical protein
MTYAEFKAGTWPEKRYGPKQESLYLWLGMDKREINEDRTIWGHLLNAVLHASIGMVSSVALGCISVHAAFVIIVGSFPSILREYAWQYAKNHQAHIVDRWWDISEGIVGAVIGWGIVAIVHYYKPEVFGWLF